MQERLEGRRGKLMERLGEVAGARGWHIHRADGQESAVGYIHELVKSSGAGLVVRSSQAVFDNLPIDSALTQAGAESVLVSGKDGDLRDRLATADIGITGADFAIAETGSVALVARRGVGRLVSLAPPVHVALVRPQDVVEDLEDIFLLARAAYHEGSGEFGRYMNFITGPSRTADIEQTIVIGVHGPREVHMVLLEGGADCR